MTRDISYRVDVLRNGVLYDRLLWDASSESPTIDCQKSAEIKRSMSGTFLVSTKVDLMTDELRPMMILNGHEKSLGIFRATGVLDLYTSCGKRWQVEAYDRSWLCKSNKTESVLHISAGTKYLDAIKQMLITCGIVNVIAEDSAATLSHDREDWPIGTSYLTIINTLLQELNYRDLWFDTDGFAHLEAYKSPSASSIVRQYSSSDIRRLPIGPEMTGKTDIFNAPNVFVVVCSNGDNTKGYRAVAENDSPISSKSTFRRGRRIVQVVHVNQISDTSALQGYANQLRDESLISNYQLKFEAPAEPDHGVGDIIGIDEPNVGGIYEEASWSLTLAVGEMMQINAQKMVVM